MSGRVNDLDAAIRAKLDEVRRYTNGHHDLPLAEEVPAAIEAVLDQLSVLDGIAEGIGETRSVILGGTVQRAVDSVRRAIAEKLGVEVSA